jgi:hypothetical protein
MLDGMELQQLGLTLCLALFKSVEDTAADPRESWATGRISGPK